MKKFLYYIAVFLTVITISCNEDFSVRGPFDDEYVFDCILRCDTTTQFATISRTYEVANFNPLTNTVNPVVKNAKIKLFYKGSVYTMRDTVLPLTDPHYNTPVSCYCVKNMQIDAGQTIDAEVTMPDGKVITASTKTLPANEAQYEGPYTIPEFDPHKALWLDHVTFMWMLPSYMKDPYSAKLYYAPQLTIEYYKKENGNSILMKKIVPDDYIVSGDKLVPHYPEPRHVGICTYDTAIVGRAMREISENDSNKSNYLIIKVFLTVLMFDENLAPYYAADQTFDSGASLNLSPPDLSSINGGKGIFGSFMKITKNVNLYDWFLDRFGYQYANAN